MPIVSFRHSMATDGALIARAPLEILDEGLSIAQRTRVDASVTLDAGTYAARATLPDGVELSGVFSVGNADAIVDLLPRHTVQAKQSSRDFAWASNAILEAIKSVGLEAATNDPAADEIDSKLEIRTLIGHAYDSGLKPSGAWVRLKLDEETVLQNNSGQVVLEVNGSDWLFVVPVKPHDTRKCRAVVGPLGIAPHFVFDDPDLELLLRYLGEGCLSPAGALVGDESAMLARNAFRDKVDRPIAAMAGAFVMLALGRHEELLGWTGELCDRFDWSPDALIIHGETLARAGRHEEAINVLQHFYRRGLPNFSAGATYLTARLQQYQAAVSAGKELKGEADALFTPIQYADWLSRRMDADRPLLTIRPPAIPPLESLSV